MELTVTNNFQNNLDQATINSILSHLADTQSGKEICLKTRKENNHTAYSGKIPLTSSKSLEPCLHNDYHEHTNIVMKMNTMTVLPLISIFMQGIGLVCG